MRRGIGHFARKGSGGGAIAAQRMGATARTAGALYGALSSLAAGQTAQTAAGALDRNALQGRSVDQLITTIVESVRPVDGTQDGEVARNALQGALSSELLERYPQADLLDLSEEQRLFVIERYMALDIFCRVELEVGKAIQDKAPTASVGLARLREVKNYIKQTVASIFREIVKKGDTLSPRRVAGIVRQAIQQTFDVFAGAEE